MRFRMLCTSSANFSSERGNLRPVKSANFDNLESASISSFIFSSRQKSDFMGDCSLPCTLPDSSVLEIKGKSSYFQKYEGENRSLITKKNYGSSKRKSELRASFFLGRLCFFCAKTQKICCQKKEMGSIFSLRKEQLDQVSKLRVCGKCEIESLGNGDCLLKIFFCLSPKHIGMAAAAST